MTRFFWSSRCQPARRRTIARTHPDEDARLRPVDARHAYYNARPWFELYRLGGAYLCTHNACEVAMDRTCHRPRAVCRARGHPQAYVQASLRAECLFSAPSSMTAAASPTVSCCLFQRDLGRGRGAAAPRRTEQAEGPDRAQRAFPRGNRIPHPTYARYWPAIPQGPRRPHCRTDQAREGVPAGHLVSKRASQAVGDP